MCRKKGEMIRYGPHGTKDIHGMIGVEKDARAGDDQMYGEFQFQSPHLTDRGGERA